MNINIPPEKMEKMNKFGALGQKDIDRYIEKLDNVIKKE